MYDREDRNDKVYTDGSGRIPGYDPPEQKQRPPKKPKGPRSTSPNARANAAQADDKGKAHEEKQRRLMEREGWEERGGGEDKVLRNERGAEVGVNPGSSVSE